MIFFTSDLHFGHEKLITMQHRPFADAEEMNEALISNWNLWVGERDEVYILGDVTMKGAVYAETMLRRLKGRKYLVRGNHDRFVDQADFDRSLFEWIKDYYVLHSRGERFVLFHYPIEEWDQFYRGAYHLHGHQHNDAAINELVRDCKGIWHGDCFRRYDVGVDANKFAPVSLEEIVAFFEKGEA